MLVRGREKVRQEAKQLQGITGHIITQSTGRQQYRRRLKEKMLLRASFYGATTLGYVKRTKTPTLWITSCYLPYIIRVKDLDLVLFMHFTFHKISSAQWLSKEIQVSRYNWEGAYKKAYVDVLNFHYRPSLVLCYATRCQEIVFRYHS